MKNDKEQSFSSHLGCLTLYEMPNGAPFDESEFREMGTMSKIIARRYVSEEAIKRALKIDSFRNLSKDKIMQFASMIPYMDKDVAISAINQFPAFAESGKTIISYYKEICDSILLKSKESQEAVIHGYQTILDALAKRMDSENITEAERKAITEDMIKIADKIAEADLQYKKFLERLWIKFGWTVLGIVAMIGAGIGIHSAFGNSQELPQLEEDEDDAYDEDDDEKRDDDERDDEKL